MNDIVTQLLLWKLAIIASWFLLHFASERLAPRAANPHADEDGVRGWRRLLRNLGLFVPVFFISVLIVVPVSNFAADHALGWRPDWWQENQAVGLMLDILILDFWIYWWHRANHEIQFLWRFHEIHHLDHFLDSSSAVRFHFGEVVLSAFVRAGVILALGMPIQSVVLFEIIVLCSAIFHHSNIRLPAMLEKLLSFVIITPSIHWVHHHALRADTDSNYGTLFSFWDPLFKSRSPNARRLDMEIGVEGEVERDIIPLLLRPFRWK